MHWQRADRATGIGGTRPPSTFPVAHPNSHSGSISSPQQPHVEEESASHEPRPPSYISDDGVSYAVSAVPRSVAPSMTGMSDVHPAWRPGFAV